MYLYVCVCMFIDLLHELYLWLPFLSVLMLFLLHFQ